MPEPAEPAAPLDDGGPDPWAEADRAWDRQSDRAWDRQSDRWAEADRAWSARDYAALPAPDASARPVPVPARGVVRGYAAGMSAAGPYLGLGAQIAGSMLGFVGLGIVLDRSAGTGPWGVIGGAVFGLLGVMALVVRLSIEASARDRKRRDDAV